MDKDSWIAGYLAALEAAESYAWWTGPAVELAERSWRERQPDEGECADCAAGTCPPELGHTGER